MILLIVAVIPGQSRHHRDYAKDGEKLKRQRFRSDWAEWDYSFRALKNVAGRFFGFRHQCIAGFWDQLRHWQGADT